MKNTQRNHKKPKNMKPQNKKAKTGAMPYKGRHTAVQQRTLAMSDETDVQLKYRYQATNAFASGPLVYKTFSPNGAYDVDPAVGSTETLGFDEYAAFYSYYRVVSYSYKLQVAANSGTADAITVYALNTNTQITGSPNLSLFATTAYCQTKMMGPYGNHAVIVLTGRHQVAQILGSKVPETEDNYRALTTANPADLVWLTIGFESPTATNCACSWILDITMTTRFYGREYDLTLTTLEAKIHAKILAREEYILAKKLKSIKA
jgi:hypothetical protein